MKNRQLMMNGKPYRAYGPSDLIMDMLNAILRTGSINEVTLTYKTSNAVNVFTLEPVKCDSCGQDLP